MPSGAWKSLSIQASLKLISCTREYESHNLWLLWRGSLNGPARLHQLAYEKIRLFGLLTRTSEYTFLFTRVNIRLHGMKRRISIAVAGQTRTQEIIAAGVLWTSSPTRAGCEGLNRMRKHEEDWRGILDVFFTLWPQFYGSSHQVSWRSIIKCCFSTICCIESKSEIYLTLHHSSCSYVSSFEPLILISIFSAYYLSD